MDLFKTVKFIVRCFMINQKLFAQFVARYLNKHSCNQTKRVSQGEVSEEKQEGVELTCPDAALHIVNSEQHEDAVTQVSAVGQPCQWVPESTLLNGYQRTHNRGSQKEW